MPEQSGDYSLDEESDAEGNQNNASKSCNGMRRKTDIANDAIGIERWMIRILVVH
jgi:hypothetical protein